MDQRRYSTIIDEAIADLNGLKRLVDGDLIRDTNLMMAIVRLAKSMETDAIQTANAIVSQPVLQLR